MTVAIDQPVNDFAIAATGEQTVKLSALKGKQVVIVRGLQTTKLIARVSSLTSSRSNWTIEGLVIIGKQVAKLERYISVGGRLPM